MPISGRFSPLRYPGGKGKLAKFMAQVVSLNNIQDGCYVEPYAGGAGIAWELLQKGLVRRVVVNDISRPIAAFWRCVVDETDEICRRINDTPVTVSEWDKAKKIYTNPDCFSDIDLAFAFFFLNRTNRSGILNAGIIGGRKQAGDWKIDARFNKIELIHRIEGIAKFRSRIELFELDAVEFLTSQASNWPDKTLVYIDPPYYEKGRYLYHDSYKADDHKSVAIAVKGMTNLRWIVSYDDVRPIHDLYSKVDWLQYTLSYSARNRVRGREAIFHSPKLSLPPIDKPMQELARGVNSRRKGHIVPASREFAGAS